MLTDDLEKLEKESEKYLLEVRSMGRAAIRLKRPVAILVVLTAVSVWSFLGVLFYVLH